MTGGSVMDWWGEGRGARPLVVRDMSSGARDRTCVEGALRSALQGLRSARPSVSCKKRQAEVPGQRVRIHTTLETIDLAGETSDEAHET